MKRYGFYFYWVVLSLSVSAQSYGDQIKTEALLAEMAGIQQDEQQLAVAVEAGQDRAILCGSCHGKNGNSVRNYIPNLASQNPAYLFNQFEMFANGERKDYVMGRLAKNLTRQDRINIALYFSQMPVEVRAQVVPSSVKGEQVYQTACFSCHQQDGHGDGNYPRIAGQPYEYLINTLNGFSGADDRRTNSIMAGIIKTLNKQQILDVAAYVASMR